MSTPRVKYSVWCHQRRCAYYQETDKLWEVTKEEVHVKDDYKQHMLDCHTTAGTKYTCNWKIGDYSGERIPCEVQFDLGKIFPSLPSLVFFVSAITVLRPISVIEKGSDALWKHVLEDHIDDGAVEIFVEAAPKVWVYSWKWEELKGEKPDQEWLGINRYSSTL
ncbi:hypothetical protein E6O75_ATG03605 [Venturia nashicola]|uniref:Uncharacterized protein n=1 Tax=Venturia nashicola TaxID=86259 RepID=A0A4Z1PRQ5_9PEZI|nr:hypothetical protein E6O75_ATG03605 [Venturia nashicola]